jgi:phosphatidylglycerophosphatase A
MCTTRGTDPRAHGHGDRHTGRTDQKMNRTHLWFRRILASVFFLGYVPVMPGTFGSALVAALLWAWREKIGTIDGPLWWLVILAGAYACMILCNRAREVFGREDPPQIVLDECLGQLVTFFMLPLSWRVLVTGFVLFRFFDIVKPYPVYRMEEIDDGAGVVMDDVVAGLWANASLWIILLLYRGIAAYL